jgi:hypothetical protein
MADSQSTRWGIGVTTIVTGHRHGSRVRELDGNLREDRDRGAACGTAEHFRKIAAIDDEELGPPQATGAAWFREGWQKPCHNAHRSAVSAPRRHASAWRALGRTAIRPGGELGTVRPWPTAVARRDRARASVGGYVGEIGLGIDAINLDGCFATNLGLTDGTALLHAAATDPGSGS